MATDSHDEMYFKPPRDTGYVGSLSQPSVVETAVGFNTELPTYTDQSDRLKTKIEQLRDKIQRLSARRSPGVRKFVQDAL